MDLGAVKSAPTPELVRCLVGAAANTRGLVDDAELLSAAGRPARAYSLAVLAVEEAGKAAGLVNLAMMPASLRAQAPVGRLLGWHQLKLVGGVLIAAVPFTGNCVAARLATLPIGQVAGILDNAQALAQELDRLKQRGLYVDIDRSGLTRLPSEVTEADVAAQLDLARQAAWSVSAFFDPDTPAWLADPPTDAIELSRALVRALTEAGSGRTPEAAARAMLNAVTMLRAQTAAQGAVERACRLHEARESNS